MRLRLLLGFLLFVSLNTVAQSNSDQQALLRVHVRDREAHMKGDANLLTADTASEIVDVGRGEFKRTTRDEVREHFATFFKQAKYSSYEDVTPPIIHISSDGRSAFMAVQIRAKLTISDPGKPPQDLDFQTAWLATYEKQNGKWLMVAIGYSVPAGK